MPDFTRVLCAIDLTGPSRRALDCALWWARRHGADVSVLHVHQVTPSPDPGAMASDPAMAAPGAPAAGLPLTREEREARLAAVEDFVAQARTDDLQLEVLLDEDLSVADAIAARADALAADLIVVGAGTGAPSEHPVLGRITIDVLREAPCSVLVIPTPGADVANPCFGGLKRIMCAVSLSEGSRSVLDCAASLALQTASHLTVVHVVELFSEMAALAYDFDAHREARLQPAIDDLVHLVATAVGRDKPVEEIVAQGTPCNEILKLAGEEDIDLMVMGLGAGQRGRGPGRPTGQAVAREARCPVLFLRIERPEVAVRPDPEMSEEAPLDSPTAAAASRS